MPNPPTFGPDGLYPHMPNDPFYQQFHDPQRAYSNMNHLLIAYRESPEIERPSTCGLDHVLRAWDDAHKAPDGAGKDG